MELKLGILSDIHVDLEGCDHQKILQELVEAIKQLNKVEMMIIAGDVGNDFEVSLRFPHQIEAAAGVGCLYVPGNHDIWNENHLGKTAWETYDALQSFSGNLAKGPVALNDDPLIGVKKAFKTIEIN